MLFCSFIFHFSEKMHFFEFGVTSYEDWRDVQTVYVKAESSHEAIKFMLNICQMDEIFSFIDFKFRTALPECCIENNATIFSEND